MNGENTSKDLNVIFRVDDFPLTKPEESWRHNLDNFKRFDAVMEKHGVRYVLGVIPRHTTDEHLSYLRDNPRVTVALHGVDHDERFLNEFREHLTEREISRIIKVVKGHIEDRTGQNIDIYIPPHNVIDQRTCRALKGLGFKKVLCGPGTDEKIRLYGFDLGLPFIWSSPPDFYGRSDEMSAELRTEFGLDRLARMGEVCKFMFDDGHPAVIGLHWTWEMNIGLEHLDRYLQLIVPVMRRKQ